MMKCRLTPFFIHLVLSSIIIPQENDSLLVKSPKQAAIYGALFPGGGQMYNESWIKVTLVLALEGAAIYQWQRNLKIYKSYEEGNYTLPKHRYLEKRNKYAWWMGFIYIFGLLDAVVDAHLMPFDDIMNENLEKSEPKKREEK